MIPVLQYPKHKAVLRQKSSVVANVSEELVNDMAEYQGKCEQGLSAVQLGVPVRLIMVKYGEGYIFLLNPVIVKASAKMYKAEEGCLSIDHGKKRITIRRHKIVKVKYADLDWNQRTIKARNLDASCLQHEIDHLEGKLIIDYEKVGAI